MKKVLLFIAAILLSFSMSAQTSQTVAIDFTATDCHGTEVHLFDILDGGQYVLIDFFYTTCGPCQLATPKVVEAYHALGCNDFEVFFMEISPYNDNSQLQNWCSTYGVEYPTIGTSSIGASICNSYGIGAYPTLILIAPNHQIVIQDLWPINDAQSIINALAPYGIQQHECGSATNPSVEITIGEISETSVEASFAPNESCASYSILMSTDAEMQQWVTMMGMSLEELIVMWGIEYTSAATYTWTDMVPNTEYTVYAVPKDADGTLYPAETALATTGQSGGSGTAVIALDVTVLSETSVRTLATPNDETAEYHYGLITKEFYEEIGIDSTLTLIRNDNYPLYDVDEWTWIDLIPNTYYYAISTGVNANGEWGETTIVEFVTSLVSVETEDALSFEVYPNPASDYIRISGEGIKTVEIYNTFGQKINAMSVNAPDVLIPAKSLDNGTYFVKVNGKTVKKCVVIH